MVKPNEPESLGAITLASREKLDNLIFVINLQFAASRRPCARQWDRLIQELESAFPRGSLETSSRFCGEASGTPSSNVTPEGLLVKRMANWWMANTRSWSFPLARMFASISSAAILACSSSSNHSLMKPCRPPASWRARSAQGLCRVQIGRRS